VGGYNGGVATDVERLIAFFNARANVAAVYLFGSAATGTDRPGSDLDVAVLFQRPPARVLNGPRFEMEGELEAVFGRPVDLLVLNDAATDLAIRVLRHGRLLIAQMPAVRIGFEVRTRNEAFDLEPVLTQYRAARSSQS